MFYFTPYAILPFVSSVICGGLAWFAKKQRPRSTAILIFWFMLLLSGWALSYALNTSAAHLSIKIFFFKTGTLFAAFIGVAILAIALDATGYGQWLTRRRTLLFAVFPAFIITLAWTAEFHTLFRHSFFIQRSGPLLVLGFKHGPLWYPHLLYINALNLTALVLFVAGYRRGPRRLRSRFVLLSAGTLVPLLIENLGLTPVPGFSMLTSTFWFTGACYTLAIFRHGLLNVAPVARGTLFNRLEEPILVYDHSGLLIDCNQASRDLLSTGSKADLDELSALARLRFPSLEPLTRNPFASIEDIVEDAGEKNRYWRIKSLPLAKGLVAVGNLVQLYDISRLKRNEEELRKANQAAETASRAKSVFLANMSHEIRTPMNAIIGFTDLVLSSRLAADQRSSLETVRRSSAALLSILNDIMDFSKIEAGKMELEKTAFSLLDVIKTSVDTLSLEAGQKGLSLSFSIPPGFPETLLGDPGRLQQILINLLGNAVKFTAKGGVYLTVQPVNGLHQPSGQGAEDSFLDLLFCVRDTGIGIPGEKLDSVFLSFTQADNSITRRYGGTGLGLTISRELVRMMGGELKVESKPHQGSTFYFTLRFAVMPSPRPGQAETGRVEPRLDRPLNILMVEDLSINRTLAERLLQRRGHRITCADNGEIALKLLEREPFDLVLMDLQMPVMDGYQTTRIIRDPKSAVLVHDIPIVALTAHAGPEYRERCLVAGMNGYLSKPILPGQLLAEVERYAGFGRWGRDVPARLETEVESNEAGPEQPDPAERQRKELMRVYSDEKLAQELIGIFRKEMPAHLNRLKTALDSHDSALLTNAAHAAKSAAGAAGLPDVGKLFAELEEAAARTDFARASVLRVKTEKELAAFFPDRSSDT